MSHPAKIATGYLLKRSRDHRKTHVLGTKYNRRWVEVTADTVLYAAEKHDVLTGRIAVFAVGEMLWVKPDQGDNKFQVKFPERALKFKVANGGREERDKWVAAFLAAQQQCAAARKASQSGAAKLEHLQQALLGPQRSLSSTDGGAYLSPSPGSSTLCSPKTSCVGSTCLSQAAVSSHAVPPQLAACLPADDMLNTVQHPSSESSGQRPLSPRALLASAKTGMAMVGSMSPSRPSTGSGTPSAASSAQAQHCATQRKDILAVALQARVSECDDSASQDSSDAESSDTEHKQQQQQPGVNEPMGSSDHQSRHGTKPVSKPLMLNDGLPSQAACGAGSSPRSATTPGTASAAAHRPNLGRRVTPGVLLTSASSSCPTTPGSSATRLAELVMSASTSQAHSASTAARIGSLVGSSAGTSLEGTHASFAPACITENGDDVLRLEEMDTPSLQQHAPAPQHQHQHFAWNQASTTLQDSDPRNPAPVDEQYHSVYKTPLYHTTVGQQPISSCLTQGQRPEGSLMSRSSPSSSGQAPGHGSSPFPGGKMHATVTPVTGAAHHSSLDALDEEILRLGIMATADTDAPSGGTSSPGGRQRPQQLQELGGHCALTDPMRGPAAPARGAAALPAPVGGCRPTTPLKTCLRTSTQTKST